VRELTGDTGAPRRARRSAARKAAAPGRARAMPSSAQRMRDATAASPSEKGLPAQSADNKLDGRAYETEAAAVWFLAVDSKGEATTGDAYEWRAPIRVKPDVRRVSNGYRVSVLAIPRGATIPATLTSRIQQWAGGFGRDRSTRRRDALTHCRRSEWPVLGGGERQSGRRLTRGPA
jgi:hypothetical protein